MLYNVSEMKNKRKGFQCGWLFDATPKNTAQLFKKHNAKCLWAVFSGIVLPKNFHDTADMIRIPQIAIHVVNLKIVNIPIHSGCLFWLKN